MKRRTERRDNRRGFYRNKLIATMIIVMGVVISINSADNKTEFGVMDDFTVWGVEGTLADPDLEIKGFSVFGATQTAYTANIANSPGNVMINGVLGVSSGAYIAGISTINYINTTSMTITGNGITGSSPIFKVAGSTMVILNNGNVGIGTISPGQKLEVAGIAGTDGIKFPDGSTQLRGMRIYRKQVSMGVLYCGNTYSPTLTFDTVIANEWVTLIYSVTGRTNACGHAYGDIVVDNIDIHQGSGADERGCTWRRTITQMVNKQIAGAGSHTFQVNITCGSGASTFSDNSGEWFGGGTFLTVIAGGGN